MSVDVGSAIAYLDLDTSGFTKGLDGAWKEFKKFTDKSLPASERLKELGEGFSKLGDDLTKKLTKPIVTLGTGMIAAAVSFEDAFAGVQKTVDGTEEQLEKIRQGILALSEATASSAVEIAAVAEAAGQLGVATDDILEFTEIMVMLGDSTNLSAEEAATSLARFMNIMGTTNDEVENLGSTIVDLGNNFATTESEIVAMSTRLASSGKIVGLTETQVLALSTAMSSVGIQAEAGSTAMAQTLTVIESAVANGSEKMFEFARISGMSAAEFSETWQKEPIVAIQAFMNGLGELESKGENATLVLDDLGLTGIRQSNMLKALSSASDILSDSISVANGAWEENNALTKEAEKRYATTKSQLKQTWESLKNIGTDLSEILLPIVLDFLEGLRGVISWFKELDDYTKKSILTIMALAAALGPILKIVGTLIKLISSIAAIAPYLNPVTGTLAAMGVGVAALVVHLASYKEELSETQQQIRNTTEETNKLAEANKDFIESLNESAEARRDNFESIEVEAEANHNLLDELKELQGKTNLTATEQAKQQSIVDQLNSSVEGLNLSIDEQTGKLNTSVEAIEKSIDAMRRQAIVQAAQEDMAAIAIEQYEIEKKLVELRKQQAEQYDALKIAEEELIAVNNQYENSVMSMSGSAQVAGDTASQSLDEATVAYGNISREIAILTNRQKELESEYAVISEFETSHVETIKNVADSYVALSYEVEQAGVSISGMSESSIQAMNDLYTSVKGTIEDQISLFEEFDGAMKTSGEEMLANMQSQVEGITEWSDNLQTLADRGINQGLLAQLAQLGPEGAGYVKSFVDMTDAELEAANEAFVQSTSLSEEVAAQIAESYKQAGAGTAEGFIEGMEGALPDVNSGGINMGNAALYSAQITLGMSGSFYSSKMEHMGNGYVEGFANGVESNKEKISNAVSGMIIDLYQLDESFYSSGDELFSSLWQGMQDVWSEMETWLGGVSFKISEFSSNLSSTVEAFSVTANSLGIDGSHANGLSYVPYNGYIAELHEGERVLTKQENEDYNKGSYGTGDTFNFYSPEPIDEYQAARLLRQTKKDLERY